jgi:hypothetical protein
MERINLFKNASKFNLDKIYKEFLYLLKQNKCNKLYELFKDMYLKEIYKNYVRFVGKIDHIKQNNSIKNTDISIALEYLLSLIHTKEDYEQFKNIDKSSKYYNMMIYMSKCKKLDNPRSYDITNKFISGLNEELYNIIFKSCNIKDVLLTDECLDKKTFKILFYNKYPESTETNIKLVNDIVEKASILENDYRYIDLHLFDKSRTPGFGYVCGSFLGKINTNIGHEKVITKKINKISTNKKIVTQKNININEQYNQLIKALNNMNYNKYLQTEHWKYFRIQAYEYYNNKCCLCNSTYKLNLHHNNYNNRGRETFTDVILLCNKCHSKFHDL